MSDRSDREVLQRRFLLLSVSLVSIVFLWMIRNFLLALFLAALTAGMCRPLFLRVARWLGGREGLASGAVVILVLVLAVGPTAGLIGLVVRQAIEITDTVTPWVQQQIADPTAVLHKLQAIPFVDRLPGAELLPEKEQLIQSAGNAVKATGTILINGAAAAGRMTAVFLLQLFIFLYAMFFFLFQGPQMLDRILYLTPLEPAAEQRVLERFQSITRATLRGSLLIGALQGTLAGLAFWAAGIQGAAFWGTVMMVLSVVPGVGTPLIWVPAAIWLFSTGQVAAGAGLTAWCALVVGTVDNVLRPRLVGSDAKMSDLMIMLSTLGGISLFGPVGFVVGPILAGVFMTSWDLYAEAFAGALPATEERAHDAES